MLMLLLTLYPLANQAMEISRQGMFNPGFKWSIKTQSEYLSSSSLTYFVGLVSTLNTSASYSSTKRIQTELGHKGPILAKHVQDDAEMPVRGKFHRRTERYSSLPKDVGAMTITRALL